jgi:hypothetical protein
MSMHEYDDARRRPADEHWPVDRMERVDRSGADGVRYEIQFENKRTERGHEPRSVLRALAGSLRSRLVCCSARAGKLVACVTLRPSLHLCPPPSPPSPSEVAGIQWRSGRAGHTFGPEILQRRRPARRQASWTMMITSRAAAAS